MTDIRREPGSAGGRSPSRKTPPSPRKAKPKAAKPKKLSAIDAAAKVLGESGEARNCQEMIKAMAEKGYWTSPGGKTPALPRPGCKDHRRYRLNPARARR